MSHPNPDREERVKRCPERVFIELDDNGDYHTSPRGFHDAEYIRADIAATRMRDRCLRELKNLIDAEQSKHLSAHVAVRRMALHDAITALQSLVLDVEEK